MRLRIDYSRYVDVHVDTERIGVNLNLIKLSTRMKATMCSTYSTSVRRQSHISNSDGRWADVLGNP